MSRMVRSMQMCNVPSVTHPGLLSASGTCVVGVWIPCAAELRSILYECGLQNIPRRARARAAAARAPRPPAPSPVQARLQIWLVFIASTTVGYGDIYPVTHAGRIIVIVAALAGVSLASLMAAACSNAIAWSEDQERVLLMLRRRAAQIDLLSKAQARRTPPSRPAPPPRCAAPPPRSAAAPRSGLRWWGVGCDRRVVSCAEERPAPGDEDAPRAARVQGAQGSSSLRPPWGCAALLSRAPTCGVDASCCAVDGSSLVRRTDAMSLTRLSPCCENRRYVMQSSTTAF